MKEGTEVGEDGGKVRCLIEKATDTTASEVDPRLLKAIKSVVRNSDSELRFASQTLMLLMKRDHSQVRYLAFLIIDELFMRSKLFRTIVVESFDQLLSLSIGFRRTQPLPGPAAVACTLRAKAVECLEKWNISFGCHYRQIRLGFDYLKNTLRFQFPNLQANAARIQKERREREMRSKEILRTKFDGLKENLSTLKGEIRSTINEISQCLEILYSKAGSGENVPLDLLDDDEYLVEFRSMELQQLRLCSMEETETVAESGENKVVFDALRELYKVLVSKHLASVQEGMATLMRVELEDDRLKDFMLKELIDLRNQVQSVKKRCEESGFALSETRKHTNEEEEDFWEEGKIESAKSTEIGRVTAPSTRDENVSTTTGAKNVACESSMGKSKYKKAKGKNKQDESNSTFRDELLAEAPVLNWSAYLADWGSKRDVLANSRGLEIESHWGRVDYDAVIPADKIAELSLPVTYYKEDGSATKPCHAPLLKGGLCQIRDSSFCPYHGLIIHRDANGNPINESDSKDEMTPAAAADLAERMANQAVKNVRERDKEEERKRKLDKKSVAQAKRAKIREHNEAVLKDAALASTSYSDTIVENDGGTSFGGRSSTKNKRDTLASMLRKKVSSQDRLAQKLLNTRVSDATQRQIRIGEDANYREAFPNQW